MVVEVPEIIWGGSRDYMVVVCKPILVFSLSLSQAEQYSFNFYAQSYAWSCVFFTRGICEEFRKKMFFVLFWGSVSKNIPGAWDCLLCSLQYILQYILLRFYLLYAYCKHCMHITLAYRPPSPEFDFSWPTYITVWSQYEIAFY